MAKSKSTSKSTAGRTRTTCAGCQHHFLDNEKCKAYCDAGPELRPLRADLKPLTPCAANEEE